MSYFDDNENRIVYGGQGRLPRPNGVVCKHCGVAGLRWHQQQHWALVDRKGAVHQCARQVAAVDDFDDLT